jgi:hypothetical protein
MANEYISGDKANPNDLPDFFRKIALGSLLMGQMTQQLRKKDLSAASSYALATLGCLVLPDNGKAAVILRAYARAGTGTLGELTVVAFGVTPTAGQIAVSPNGDIVCLLADAYTSVDIDFVPERGDSNALDRDGNVNNTSAPGNVFPVVTNVITLPAVITARGVILLAEAEALQGTATGKKVVLVPGAGAPSAGQARLNLAKSTITFATADAVTRARVKLVLCANADLATVLNSTQTLI